MSIAYAKHFSTTATPQTEPIPGSNQVPNSAGGFSFPVDDWTRLNRFIILGAEGGSYYASERTLTIENAQCVIRCLDADPERTVRTIAEVSDAGRAPKNDPAVFALAIAAGHKDPTARRAALESLPRVARTPTHLYQFFGAVKGFRGRGQGLHRAIQRWYEAKTIDQLAYHVGKYQSREGWSHGDILRLARPGDESPARGAIYRWAIHGKDGLGARTIRRGEKTFEYPAVSAHLPAFLAAVDEAKGADEAGILRLIREHDLPRECIPTERLNSPAVWEALLAKMPLTAMVRNLGKMTAVGLLNPFSAAAKTVVDRLGDRDYIRKSRLHPMAILVAAKVYGQGHGDKGSLQWQPVSAINDAMDAAFYLAFDNVEPAGKRTLVGLDVSASMDGGYVAGTPLTPREASAALALIIARTEPQYQVVGFTSAGGGSPFSPWDSTRNGLTLIDLSSRSRLTDVIQHVRQLPMGGTDCALPMLYAAQAGLDVDTFITLTDSESWAGPIHASQALVQYRQKRGIPARAICVGMVANSYSVLDPADAGSLNVVGFDTSTPSVMSQFSAGRL